MITSSSFMSLSVASVASLSALCLVLSFVGLCFYNVYLHPLRAYPGPWCARASRLYYIYLVKRGRLTPWVKQMHDLYGDTVRIAPDELSYRTYQAWQDICGHGINGKKIHMEKDPVFLMTDLISIPTIINTNEEDHRRHRRVVAHPFSEKALRMQEPILSECINKFISGLRKESAKQTPSANYIDVVPWFFYTTFDVIGDLAFGEPFGCLEKGGFHPWVEAVFSLGKDILNLQCLIRLPGMWKMMQLIKRFMPVDGGGSNLLDFAQETARKRMSTVTERPDFMTYIMKNNDSQGLSKVEIENTAANLIVAGSEPTAVAAGAALYYLLSTPLTFDRLVHDIRSTFASEDELNMENLQKLSYLNAVIDETLRIHPPAPSTFPRLCPGAVITGEWVPAGTTVGVSQLSSNRSAANFTDPDMFVPERWMKETPYPNDNLKSSQPFSFGPRGCLGKNLAYSVLRLLLSRIIWNFDLQLDPSSSGPYDARPIHMMWDKRNLNIKLTLREN